MQTYFLFSAIVTTLAMAATFVVVAIALGKRRSVLARRRSLKCSAHHAPAAATDAYVHGAHASGTCPHLQPIEQAMRQAGVALYPRATLAAQCVIDAPRLRQVLQPMACVSYIEPCGDSSAFDVRAVLYCSDCGSTIHAVHPRRAQLRTPEFPARPSDSRGLAPRQQ